MTSERMGVQGPLSADCARVLEEFSMRVQPYIIKTGWSLLLDDCGQTVTRLPNSIDADALRVLLEHGRSEYRRGVEAGARDARSAVRTALGIHRTQGTF